MKYFLPIIFMGGMLNGMEYGSLGKSVAMLTQTHQAVIELVRRLQNEIDKLRLENSRLLSDNAAQRHELQRLTAYLKQHEEHLRQILSSLPKRKQ